MGRLLRLLLPLSVACASACAIWPEPQTIQSGSSPLKIHSDFSISLTIPSKSAPADLHAAISRTQSYLKTDKLGRLTPDRGASDAAVLADAPSVRSLVLELADYEESEESAPIASISEESQRRLEDRDEAYTLIVPSSGEEARARATSTLGLLRALSTFEQIWSAANDEIYTLEAPYTIIDEPAYVSRLHPCWAGGNANLGLVSHTVASCWIPQGTCLYSARDALAD